MNIKTFVCDSVCVSTVRLTFYLDGKPYETMVFPGKDMEITSYEDIESQRYVSEEEARAGHAAMVEKYLKVGA